MAFDRMYEDVQDRTDQYALRHWAGNAPDMQEPRTYQDEVKQDSVRSALPASSDEAPKSESMFGTTFAGTKTAPTPPDQLNRAVPTDLNAPAEYKPSRTDDWRAWEQKMLKYSGAKATKEIAAVRDEVGAYKQRRFNEAWGKGLALHQQGDVAGAADAYQKAYDYVTNGQGVVMQGDPEKGLVLAKPFHERTGAAGAPTSFSLEEAQQIPGTLGPATFGRDPAGQDAARWGKEQRERRLEPYEQEAKAARADLGRASAEGARGRTRRNDEAWAIEKPGLERQEADIEAYRKERGTGGAFGPFASLVERAAAAEGVPADLLSGLIQQESGNDPTISGDGGNSVGLGQFNVKGALADLGLTREQVLAMPPEQQIPLIAKFYRMKIDQEGGDPIKGLQRYNGGGDPNYVKNVLRHLPKGQQQALEDYQMADPGRATDWMKTKQTLAQGEQTLAKGARTAEVEERGLGLMRDFDEGWAAAAAIEDPQERAQAVDRVLAQYAAQADPKAAGLESMKARANLAKMQSEWAKGREITGADMNEATAAMKTIMDGDWVQSLTDTERTRVEQILGGGEKQTDANSDKLGNMAARIFVESSKNGVGITHDSAMRALFAFISGDETVVETLPDGTQLEAGRPVKRKSDGRNMPGVPVGSTVWTLTRPDSGLVILPDRLVSHVNQQRARTAELAESTKDLERRATAAALADNTAAPAALAVPRDPYEASLAGGPGGLIRQQPTRPRPPEPVKEALPPVQPGPGPGGAALAGARY